ncbi:MAG: hypothetical protein ACJ763_04070 [Bdellovibrionia bacterium]
MDGGALKWIKAALSVFVVFQLTVVLLAPNGDHYVGATLEPFVEPYANFFELTNKWSFFAPEPGPPPVFVEYEILGANGESIHKARFPEEKSPYFLRDRQNRRIASVEFMMPGEDRVEKVMVPYLCGKNPEAQAIKLWRVAYTVPSMEDVASGKRQFGDEVNLERRVVSHTYCERKI